MSSIPNEVAEYLGLKLGDVIEWETLMHNGKRSAKISKIEGKRVNCFMDWLHELSPLFNLNPKLAN